MSRGNEQATLLVRLLEELKLEAVESEKSLWMLQTSVKNAMEDCETARRQLYSTPSGAAVNHPRDSAVEEEILELTRRVKYIENEITKDREEKIRLLRHIASVIHGGPMATFSEQWMLTSPSASYQPSMALSYWIKELPAENASSLEKQRYFAFCASFFLSILNQQHFYGFVSLEDAAINAGNSVGHRTNLIRVASCVEEADLVKL